MANSSKEVTVEKHQILSTRLLNSNAHKYHSLKSRYVYRPMVFTF